LIQGPAVQLQNKIMNAETAGNVGMPQLKQFHMVNINMEFRHPKYYKELRKRNKSDQVISGANATAKVERAPGPGLKHQAASAKLQASSAKLIKK